MKEFYELAALLPGRIKDTLCSIDEKFADTVSEIRLRTGKPPELRSFGRAFFPNENGELLTSDKTLSAFAKNDIARCVAKLCEYSLFLRDDTITDGYFTVRGGHRVGVCGTYYKGERKSITDISSMNIRIAREHINCSDRLFEMLRGDCFGSLLFVGPPGSGKTTLLRDCIRRISGAPNYYKTSVIDERGELAAVYEGAPSFDLGTSFDVLDKYPRKKGFMIAVRSMSPRFIVCDEIGDRHDAKSLQLAAKSGVKVIASAHSDSIENLLENDFLRSLTENGVFDYIALLSDESAPGHIEKIINLRRN
ncbi:MAG: stage III sporulation protein AA [Oscillospiraceae bacterium]